MEKEWTPINSLADIEKHGLNVILMVWKDGSRSLDTLVNNQRGNWHLKNHGERKLRNLQALAYYRISNWTFCNIPYGEPLPCLDGRSAEAYVFWGFSNDGAFPIEQQLVTVHHGVPIFIAHHYGVPRPDVLVAYHILPDIYSFNV